MFLDSFESFSFFVCFIASKLCVTWLFAFWRKVLDLSNFDRSFYSFLVFYISFLFVLISLSCLVDHIYLSLVFLFVNSLSSCPSFLPSWTSFIYLFLCLFSLFLSDFLFIFVLLYLLFILFQVSSSCSFLVMYFFFICV
jgi:hypothetical protein